MATLSSPPGTAEGTHALAPWTSGQTRAQFAAVAHLRWLIFRNNFRRKNSVGDFVALLIMVPLFVLFAVGPATGAGMVSAYALSNGHPEYIAAVLWGVFVLCQLTSIQLGQPGTTFNPTELIRFPLAFRGYALIRIFFGLLSPSNLLACMMSLGIAIGITAADARLWPYAFAALGAFALANVFFTRMAMTWVDRWLSTRRAREVFTALMVLFSLGIQYVNFAFNPGFHHRHGDLTAAARGIATGQRLYHQLAPYLGVLPPSLTLRAVEAGQQQNVGGFLVSTVAVLLFAAVFFAVFALRLYKEFRGENLSSAAAGGAVAKPAAKNVTAAPVAAGAAGARAAAAVVAGGGALRFSAPPTVSAVLLKEFTVMRRTSGIFYSVFAPLIMVIFFVSKISFRAAPGMLFAASVAYTMLGIAPLSYNSLGFEAAGIQFYFLAPVRMRDVFVAKNLLNFALGALEVLAVFVTITIASKAPSPQMTISVLLWAAFTILVNTAVGNRRSITAPKKLDPGKMQNKQTSPLSALLSMGLLLLCAGVGALVMLGAKLLAMPWIVPPAALVLAGIGLAVYVKSLNGLDAVLAKHRDTLSEVLCKAG